MMLQWRKCSLIMLFQANGNHMATKWSHSRMIAARVVATAADSYNFSVSYFEEQALMLLSIPMNYKKVSMLF